MVYPMSKVAVKIVVLNPFIEPLTSHSDSRRFKDQSLTRSVYTPPLRQIHHNYNLGSNIYLVNSWR